MATYNKYNIFVENLVSKVMDLLGTAPGTDCDVLKVALTNTAPNLATHVVLGDITEITAGNGYTAGGGATTNNGSRTTTTFTLTGVKVVFTASGGTIGPFRYAVLYDDTPSSPLKPLIAEWDYGSNVTLNSGETFSVKFNGSDTRDTIFTLA